MIEKVEKLVIIGSGPAGLTAAIYAARSNLDPLVVSGRQAGGQLMLTTDVDDFPGFESGIQGPELMERMRKQAERFNTRFIDEDAISLNLNTRPFEIQTETNILQSRALIIATGAQAKWLELESEYKFVGKGVSACAVCDAPFFKDKNVIVVGGGDTAMREAQHLSKHCKKVTIVHRRDSFRAQAALIDLVKSKPNVDFLMNSKIVEFQGNDKLSSVKLSIKGIEKVLLIDGVFVAIGHSPSTSFLNNQLKTDDRGYIIIHEETLTSVEGVFGAGDVVDNRYRQAATAAGAGCKAAMDAERYLDKLK